MKKDLSDNWKEVISGADMLLLNGEMPMLTNIMAARYAQASGCKVVLDMGSQDEPVSRKLLEHVNVLLPKDSADVSSLMRENLGMDVLVNQGSDGSSYFSNKVDSYMD